ncbi:MAG: glucokinase [Hydrogenophilus sp.]|nr:glucokinase [Hydrogenophilus sp.]
MADSFPPTLLAFDVGGTNTRVLWSVAEPFPWRILAQLHYRNDDYPHFNAIVDTFSATHLARSPEIPPPQRIIIAVAGPVQNESATLTNRPAWTLDARALADRLHTPVTLINDFAAQAQGVRTLQPHEILPLPDSISLSDNPPLSRPLAVIGPGTGLGLAYLWRPEKIKAPLVLSTEGGNSRLPHLPWLIPLFPLLQEKVSQPYWELLLSGPGLVLLFELFQRLPPSACNAIAEALPFSEAPSSPHWAPSGPLPPASLPLQSPLSPPTAQAIIAAASNKDPLAQLAVQTFTATLAAFAADAVLMTWATAGVILVAGLANALTPWLTDTAFRAAFAAHPRFTDTLTAIPIALARPLDLGLRGAVLYALEHNLSSAP